MFSQLWNAAANFFAMIINAIYTFIPNYGWAIIIFTVITRLILLPLTLQQLKSSAAMKKINPLISELQKKYKDNPTKMNEEQMKLFKEYGINPLASCLPMLIQLPLILIIYQVVQRPLTHIMGIPESAIAAIRELLPKTAVSELQLIQGIVARGDALAEGLKVFGYRIINFRFLGLDLLQTPSIQQFSAMWLIPLLVVVSQWVSMRAVMPPAPKEGEEESQASQFNSTFFKIMPWMLGYISFITPAALGLYWITSSVLQALQQTLINRFVVKKEEPATKIVIEEEPVMQEENLTKKPVDPGKKNAKNRKKK